MCPSCTKPCFFDKCVPLLHETILFQEMCAPLARNHTFLQTHRNLHAWIREQLSKSAHLPDPTHAGTKYPRSGEPLTPTTGGRGHGDQDPQHMRACPSIHSTAQGHGDQHQEQQRQGPEGGAISLATHGSGSPPVPETEAPKKAPQRHLEPKCAPGCVAGVSRVCRAVFKLRAWIPQQPQPPLTPIGSCRDLHIPPNSRSTAPLRRPLSSWSCSYLARAETLRAPRCTGLVLRTHGARHLLGAGVYMLL